MRTLGISQRQLDDFGASQKSLYLSDAQGFVLALKKQAVQNAASIQQVNGLHRMRVGIGSCFAALEAATYARQVTTARPCWGDVFRC